MCVCVGVFSRSLRSTSTLYDSIAVSTHTRTHTSTMSKQNSQNDSSEQKENRKVKRKQRMNYMSTYSLAFIIGSVENGSSIKALRHPTSQPAISDRIERVIKQHRTVRMSIPIYSTCTCLFLRIYESFSKLFQVCAKHYQIN